MPDCTAVPPERRRINFETFEALSQLSHEQAEQYLEEARLQQEEEKAEPRKQPHGRPSKVLAPTGEPGCRVAGSVPGTSAAPAAVQFQAARIRKGVWRGRVQGMAVGVLGGAAAATIALMSAREWSW